MFSVYVEKERPWSWGAVWKDDAQHMMVRLLVATCRAHLECFDYSVEVILTQLFVYYNDETSHREECGSV
jgi:hypothetical protein